MSAKTIWVLAGLGLSTFLLSPTQSRAQHVHFANGVLVPYVTDGDVLVRDSQGAPLTGTNFVAQLYYGTSAAALVADTAAPARFRIPTTLEPGTWMGTDRTLSGLSAGSLVVMAVRVWDITSGPTYEQAFSRHDCGPFYFEVKPEGLSQTNYYMLEFRARNNSLDTCLSSGAPAPTFQTQPQSQTVSPGGTLTLSASVANACLYQWRFNGQLVGLRPTLTISNVQPSHSGSYQLIAGNYSGSVTSDYANVSVVPPAIVLFANDVPFQTSGERIVRWPDGSGITGTNYLVQLYYGPNSSTLQPLPDPPLRFRPHYTSLPGTWFGANRILPGIAPGTQVWLEVRMWDSRHGATFEQAQSDGGLAARFFPFTYTPPAGPLPGGASLYMESFRSYLWLSCPMFPTPIIHIQPTNHTVQAGSTVKLSVVAEYPCLGEWYFNGAPLPATQPGSTTLTITNVQRANVGEYYVRVINFDGSASATSQVARVTLTGQPRLASIDYSGGRFAFQVPANNGETFVIEATTNLNTGSAWTPISTNTAPFWFTNSTPTERQRFYRTVFR